MMYLKPWQDKNQLPLPIPPGFPVWVVGDIKTTIRQTCPVCNFGRPQKAYHFTPVVSGVPKIRIRVKGKGTRSAPCCYCRFNPKDHQPWLREDKWMVSYFSYYVRDYCYTLQEDGTVKTAVGLTLTITPEFHNGMRRHDGMLLDRRPYLPEIYGFVPIENVFVRRESAIEACRVFNRTGKLPETNPFPVKQILFLSNFALGSRVRRLYSDYLPRLSTCNTCNGVGLIDHYVRTGLGFKQFHRTCPSCDGSGITTTWRDTDEEEKHSDYKIRQVCFSFWPTHTDMREYYKDRLLLRDLCDFTAELEEGCFSSPFISLAEIALAVEMVRVQEHEEAEDGQVIKKHNVETEYLSITPSVITTPRYVHAFSFAKRDVFTVLPDPVFRPATAVDQISTDTHWADCTPA